MRSLRLALNKNLVLNRKMKFAEKIIDRQEERRLVEIAREKRDVKKQMESIRKVRSPPGALAVTVVRQLR